MKEARIILSPEAEEVYKKLNAEAETNKLSRMILKSKSPCVCFWTFGCSKCPHTKVWGL